MPEPAGTPKNVDKTWDTLTERVLRNEGRLEGQIELVKEVREADRLLIEQRSSALEKQVDEKAHALAKQLEDTRSQLEALRTQQRASDQREYREAIQTVVDQQQAEKALLREMYDEAITKNYEQSHIEIDSVKSIHDLHINKLTLRLEHEAMLAREKVTSDLAHQEDRVLALIDALRKEGEIVAEFQRVALDKQAGEYSRRLDELNGAHQKQLEFQRQSVTRELWEASEKSWDTREKADQDRIAKLERDFRSFVDTQSGQKAGRTTLVAAAVTAFTLLCTLVIVINVLTSRG